MKSKFVSFALIFMLCFTIFLGCKDNEKKANINQTEENGKVLNICVWNDEFRNIFEKYLVKKGLIPNDVTVNWYKEFSFNGLYQRKIDEYLISQDRVPINSKIDLFIVESDFARKYLYSGFLLDVKKDIGLTDKQLANQYKYTKDIMTDENGSLKGVSWQACPGGFIYRRSIAKDVLGTDEPELVQKYLSNWELFDKTAQLAKEKGYFMLSGFDDSVRVFTDASESPFVVNNKIQIDDAIKSWIKQSKLYTEKGYNNRTFLWSEESKKGASKDGKVFGYFGPSWFIDFILLPYSLDDKNGEQKIGNGSYGDWAFCEGPQSFSWGGSWICAVRGSDNIKLIKDIMYHLTCDKDIMMQIAKDKFEFTNNVLAMEELAKSDYKNEFLGNQNNIPMLISAAKKIKKENLTPYDQGLTEKLYKSFSGYFEGEIDKETAWENFYKSVKEVYPSLDR